MVYVCCRTLPFFFVLCWSNTGRLLEQFFWPSISLCWGFSLFLFVLMAFHLWFLFFVLLVSFRLGSSFFWWNVVLSLFVGFCFSFLLVNGSLVVLLYGLWFVFTFCVSLRSVCSGGNFCSFACRFCISLILVCRCLPIFRIFFWFRFSCLFARSFSLRSIVPSVLIVWALSVSPLLSSLFQWSLGFVRYSRCTFVLAAVLVPSLVL